MVAMLEVEMGFGMGFGMGFEMEAEMQMWRCGCGDGDGGGDEAEIEMEDRSRLECAMVGGTPWFTQLQQTQKLKYFHAIEKSRAKKKRWCGINISGSKKTMSLGMSY